MYILFFLIGEEGVNKLEKKQKNLHEEEIILNGPYSILSLKPGKN